jgi:serine/threonine-protein kinase
MLKPGDRIDRYTIEEPLGEGGMGRVFRAHDERLDRRVALKVLVRDEDDSARARLLREARAAAKLDHPNVAVVYDVGEFDGTPYIAMELVAGRSMRGLVGDPTVSAAERVRCMVEVARALGAAHDAGLVHRDVKPENVIVRPDGRVKVLDFGIARLSRVSTDPSAPTDGGVPTLTAEGVKVGTPTYMAPEQIRGDRVDGRCDQFAWAVTAYELFAGRAPWSGGDEMAVIASILTEDPSPPPAVAAMPQSFAAVVRRALAKRPDDRFPTMHLLVQAIEGTMHVAPSSPPAPASYPTPGSHPPSPQRFGFTRRYATREIAEIFDRALKLQNKKYAYDDIVQAAREVGLDEPTVQEAMRELVDRGTLEASKAEHERAVKRVKRYAALWGVFAAFFFLLDIFDAPFDFWFQYPTICMGLVFGLLAIRILMPSGKHKRGGVVLDAALEHDVRRMTSFLSARPAPPARVRIDAPASARVPPGRGTAERAEIEALAEAEGSGARTSSRRAG